MVHIDDSWYKRIEDSRERTGAGGIVCRRERDQILIALVKEHDLGDDQYVLPKGGVEDGEDIRAAALREIAEESGLIDLKFIREAGILARRNFKKTYWQESHYFLYSTEQTDGVATDPANYGLAWFSPDALPPMVWPDERRLLESIEWGSVT